MPDRDNRRRGAAWRETVARSLRFLGLPSAQARTTVPRTMTEAAQAGIEPDVSGVHDDWFLLCRADLSPQWGPSLDAAEQGAVLSGRRHGAVIQYRAARGAEDAFAVMSVRTLIALLRRDAEHVGPYAEFERFARQQDAAEV